MVAVQNIEKCRRVLFPLEDVWTSTHLKSNSQSWQSQKPTCNRPSINQSNFKLGLIIVILDLYWNLVPKQIANLFLIKLLIQNIYSPSSFWSYSPRPQYLVMIMREWLKSKHWLYLYDDKLIPERKRWQLQLKYLNRENVACACPVSRSTLPFKFRWLLTCESNTYRYMFHNPEKYSTVMCLCWQNDINAWQCFLATSWDSWILNWTKEFLTLALHRSDPIMSNLVKVKQTCAAGTELSRQKTATTRKMMVG